MVEPGLSGSKQTATGEGKEVAAPAGKKSKWGIIGKILLYGWPLILIGVLAIIVAISMLTGQ